MRDYETQDSINAREAVRRAIAERHGEVEEAILRRVDRCLDLLIDRASKPDYRDWDAMPPGPAGDPGVIDAVTAAVADNGQRHPMWHKDLQADVWGLVSLGTAEYIHMAEEALGAL